MAKTFPFIDHSLNAPVPDEHQRGVLAIGNFDGVHLGHQVVIAEALKLARANNAPCHVLTFEPHPRTLFKPQSPVFRLTPADMKSKVLNAFGVDGVLVLPFDRELASTSADEFVDEFLCKRARTSHVITGFNFLFGKDRQGTPEFLKKAGQQRDFGVTIVEAHADAGGEPVSSSRIRRLLGAGDVSAANRLLGYRWCVGGEVIKGAQIGRTLGYPTANLSLPASNHLAHGIYAVRMRLPDGSLRDGVASHGRRPTFDDGEALLETFVFDFDGDLYGKPVQISLFEHLRAEQKFDNVDDLVKQMRLDEDRARNVLANAEPLSELDRAMTFSGMIS